MIEFKAHASLLIDGVEKSIRQPCAVQVTGDDWTVDREIEVPCMATGAARLVFIEDETGLTLLDEDAGLVSVGNSVIVAPQGAAV